MLPSEVATKLFPSAGGVALIPVVHWISVVLTEFIEHYIPSITTETALKVEAKLVPAIVTSVPPVLGPKAGSKLVMTAVAASEYVTKLENVAGVVSKKLTLTSHGKVEE
jgi:hypothetical protein